MRTLVWNASLNGHSVGAVAAAALVGILLALLPVWWATVLVAGTAVFILILLNPLLGLLLALLAGPWGALENIHFGSSLLDSGQALLLLSLLIWLARGLAQRHIHLPPTFLNLPLAIFIFVAALSLLDAPSLPLGFKELLKWLEITAVMLVVVDVSVSRKPSDGTRSRDRVLAILLIAGLSQALIGIWQFGLRGDGPEHFLVLGRFYRAYGTFEQPNPYAGYMNLTALLAIGVFLGAVAAGWRQWTGEQRTKDKGQRTKHLLICTLFAGVTAVLCTLAVFFSWSRGAWLSFVIGGAVLVLFWPKKLWQGAALLVVAGLLFWGGAQAGIMPDFVTERVSSFSQDLRFGDVRGVAINDSNYAVLERLAHWQAALDMARQNVWLGVGFGNYEPVYNHYALINWPYALGHAHNYYLNLLAETGVSGLAAYLLLWTAVFFQTMRQLRRLEWPVRGVALGLLAVWTALTVHHLVDKLYVNNIYIHLGVMFALLQLLERESQQNSPKEALKDWVIFR